MTLKPLANLPQNPLPIKRALLSVSDKTGLIPLAKVLADRGVELISTGGTARVIREAGLTVKDVSEVTGFPECLDGRVKTLHPHIHGGILARTSHEPDSKELQSLQIDPIQLVVVNLYPFKQTISAPDCTPSKAMENIDIGGPTMIRAAAKNFAHVCILSRPGQYESFQREFTEADAISFESRKKMAAEAFQHTTDYDRAICGYFSEMLGEELPGQFNLSLKKSSTPRYGENPHQAAAVYGNQEEFIDCFHGKELSYNNFLDMDAALNLMADFQQDDPAVAIFKHTVPCGVAVDSTLKKAYEKAFSTDTVSPFGGIIICNRPMDRETAETIDQIFTEIMLAPSFTDDALKLLQKKKNRRLVRILNYPGESGGNQFRSIFGGALVQRTDKEPFDRNKYKTVTERQPSEEEWRDLIFAWKIVKHVKSNAIVFAKNGQTLGIGTGQTSRIESSEIAVRSAQNQGLSLKGSVVASDAFFPFADGVQAAAEAGSKAVIQPGGSIRDEEVIRAADQHQMAMVFTGRRHFKH
ncbi:MAG: bifunctional phosphoribosylaminoimidazolecarboxamide formyltransferase/IMP cyclohydrolase [Balneolaceae bacterium]